MAEFSMDDVVTELVKLGVDAYVEQTGGGVMCIYAGPTYEDTEYGTRYAALAGPGVFDVHGQTNIGDTEDFFIGADDWGDGETVSPTSTDPAEIARLIAGQVALTEGTERRLDASAQDPKRVIVAGAVDYDGPISGMGRALRTGLYTGQAADGEEIVVRVRPDGRSYRLTPALAHAASTR